MPFAPFYAILCRAQNWTPVNETFYLSIKWLSFEFHVLSFFVAAIKTAQISEFFRSF